MSPLPQYNLQQPTAPDPCTDPKYQPISRVLDRRCSSGNVFDLIFVILGLIALIGGSLGGFVYIVSVVSNRRKARKDRKESTRKDREERWDAERRERKTRRKQARVDDTRVGNGRKEATGQREGRQEGANERGERAREEVEMQNMGGDRAGSGQSGIQRRDFA